MARGYHQTTIVGNVGREPEMRYLQSGTAVVNFTVAVNEVWNNDSGKQEKVTWYRVAIWGKLAEALHPYIKKGGQIMCVGTASVNAYLDKDGKAQASLELNAKDVTLLGSGNGASEQDAPEQTSPEAALDF